jgi:mRNA-degrading endonuclease toxin of MazEF toxin-antitoxin module
MNRGDVYLALAPTFDGSTPKFRPMLVVQADFYNQRISKVLLAPITSNLSRQHDPAHLLINVSTLDGQASGLSQDSLVSCLNLVVLPQSDVQKKIGVLSAALMLKVDACLKSALGIP